MKGNRMSSNINFPSNAIVAENAIIEYGVIFAQAEGVTTIVHENVRIGAGAVIAGGVEIGLGAQVLPGSVVFGIVPPNAVVQGNPARIIGYTTSTDTGSPDFHPSGAALAKDRKELVTEPLGVGGAALYLMPRFTDLRGSLSVGELSGSFPFIPQRYFIVFDVPSSELRGEHAHKACHQFLICAAGSCRALLDDGQSRKELVLDRPDVGLYMPPMIWGTQYQYTHDATLLVFASHPYQADDYIRTYDEFLHEADGRKS